jgi:hypothetical protein
MKVYLVKSYRDQSYNMIIGVCSTWEKADQFAQEYMSDVTHIHYTRLTTIRECEIDAPMGEIRF